MFQTVRIQMSQVCQSSNKTTYCIATFIAITYLIDTTGCRISKKVIKNKVKNVF